MNIRSIAYPLRGTTALLLILMLAGCQSAYEKSPLMKKLAAEKQAAIRMSPEELSMRIIELSELYASTIEGAADDIIKGSSDPDIQRQALLWKLNTIPAVYRSAFYADPLVAFFDLWIFSVQMSNYFEQGPGKESFGQWHVVAQEASRKLESRTMDMAMIIGDEERISIPRTFVAQWAADHPMKSSQYFRESVIPTAAGMAAGQQIGGLRTVGSIAYTIDDITRQITALNTQLPKQLRRELQLLAQDILDKDALIRVLQQERALILQDVHNQRTATLAWLEDERKVLTADAERLIDHFFLRAVQLAVVVLVLILIAGFVSIRVLKKRNAGS